jgi:hypothetical protein
MLRGEEDGGKSHISFPCGSKEGGDKNLRGGKSHTSFPCGSNEGGDKNLRGYVSGVTIIPIDNIF